MKSEIGFFKYLLDEYADFMLIQARPEYSTILGERRISKFIGRIRDESREYVRNMKEVSN